MAPWKTLASLPTNESAPYVVMASTIIPRAPLTAPDRLTSGAGRSPFARVSFLHDHGAFRMSDSTPRPTHESGHAHASEQPFAYPLRREFVEPDWRRLPGFADVTTEQWESAQ